MKTGKNYVIGENVALAGERNGEVENRLSYDNYDRGFEKWGFEKWGFEKWGFEKWGFGGSVV